MYGLLCDFGKWLWSSCETFCFHQSQTAEVWPLNKLSVSFLSQQRTAKKITEKYHRQLLPIQTSIHTSGNHIQNYEPSESMFFQLYTSPLVVGFSSEPVTTARCKKLKRSIDTDRSWYSSKSDWLNTMDQNWSLWQSISEGPTLSNITSGGLTVAMRLWCHLWGRAASVPST